MHWVSSMSSTSNSAPHHTTNTTSAVIRFFDSVFPVPSHHLDLNRDFPDPIKNKGHDLRLPLGSEQPETLAMMNLTLSRRSAHCPFVN